jgi:predicted DNA-binding transcriptional regulator YafY
MNKLELTDEELSRVLHGLRILRKMHDGPRQTFSLKGKADEANIEQSHYEQTDKLIVKIQKKTGKLR